jgi:hypothetical protein
MRILLAIALMVTLGVFAVGCGPKLFEGPTVDAFTGRVVKDGKPVAWPEGLQLELTHEKGRKLGIPVQPDGSFTIGTMGVGKYTVMVKGSPQGGKGAPYMYTVPGGLTIEEGKTDYTIELGKDWKAPA